MCGAAHADAAPGDGIYSVEVEPLADACRFKEEGLEQVVKNGTNGVVCLLSAKAVGHFGYLRYTFDMPEDVATLLNMQIIIEPWEGNASLCAHAHPVYKTRHSALRCPQVESACCALQLSAAPATCAPH